jgi:hypothetical protein
MAGIFKNKFKYNTSDVTYGCIKKNGNNYDIGVNPTLDYGPTINTGFWNAVSAQTAGQLASYQFKGDLYTDQGPSIYVGDASTFYEYANEMGFTGYSFTGTSAALSYIARLQPDVVVCNITYPAVETNGLRLLYDAGFTASYPWEDGALYDISGRYSTAILSGGTRWVSGGTDYASSFFNFNRAAESQFIEAPGFGSQLNNFTLQVWVYFNNIYPSDQINIVSQVPVGYNNSNFFITLDTSGNVLGGFKVGGVVTSVVIDPGPTVNNWVLYSLTYDGNELKGHINNSSTNSAANSVILQTDSQPVIIGGTTNNTTGNGANNYFDGRIGVVLLYDIAYDLSVISSNYLLYSPRY